MIKLNSFLTLIEGQVWTKIVGGYSCHFVIKIW